MNFPKNHIFEGCSEIFKIDVSRCVTHSAAMRCFVWRQRRLAMAQLWLRSSMQNTHSSLGFNTLMCKWFLGWLRSLIFCFNFSNLFRFRYHLGKVRFYFTICESYFSMLFFIEMIGNILIQSWRSLFSAKTVRSPRRNGSSRCASSQFQVCRLWVFQNRISSHMKSFFY